MPDSRPSPPDSTTNERVAPAQCAAAPIEPDMIRPVAFDAVIIGGGHNGLTCAAYLAAAGLSVCVLERRAIVGGAAVTEEFHPGFRNSTASYTVSLLHPQGDRATCNLAEHGLAIVERPFANFLPLSDRDGDCLKIGGGLAATQAEVARFSQRDAQALPDYYAMLERVVGGAARAAARHAAERRTAASRALARRMEGREALSRARPRGPARRARPVHEERRRPARPLVRVGAAQGRARLRRDRRQLREPVYARARRTCCCTTCSAR